VLGFDYAETEKFVLDDLPAVTWTVGAIPYGKLVAIEAALWPLDQEAEALRRTRRMATDAEALTLTAEDLDAFVALGRRQEPIRVELVRWSLRDVSTRPGELAFVEETFAGETYRVLRREHAEAFARPASGLLLARLASRILALQRPSVEDLLGFTRPRTESPSTST